MVDWSASSCETLVGQLRDGDRMAWHRARSFLQRGAQPRLRWRHRIAGLVPLPVPPPAMLAPDESLIQWPALRCMGTPESRARQAGPAAERATLDPLQLRGEIQGIVAR